MILFGGFSAKRVKLENNTHFVSSDVNTILCKVKPTPSVSPCTDIQCDTWELTPPPPNVPKHDNVCQYNTIDADVRCG